MKDYEVSSDGRKVRSMRGPSARMYWLGHPSAGQAMHPRQPTFAISDERWANDLAAFQQLANAATEPKQMRDALIFAGSRGFYVDIADVPEAKRDLARLAAHLGPLDVELRGDWK